jgi:hypothetical protein
MMALSRPRLQVVQNDEISKAIATIRKYRPGLINDSMVVTSALVEHALGLESENVQSPSNEATPYGMTILRAGYVTSDVGIFQFFIKNLKYIAAIIAHIDSEEDEFLDYISRGKKPAYTFVMKGKGFTDFEFIHVTTSGSFFEECLTLLVLDLKYHCDDIRFDIVRSKFLEDRWGQKSISDYIPSLHEMAKIFFQDKSYLFGGGGGQTSTRCDLGWEADVLPYHGVNIRDTRCVDYSHALVGLKETSLSSSREYYAVENLVGSGVLAVDRNFLHRRFRCMCDGWAEEQQDLDLYEIGLIFLKHFGADAAFSPARVLSDIASPQDNFNALVYIENGKRLEILPMDWSKDSWFIHYVDGKSDNQGWSVLENNPNPFRLYDMADFHPRALEAYKQKKKNPKQ